MASNTIWRTAGESQLVYVSFEPASHVTELLRAQGFDVTETEDSEGVDCIAVPAEEFDYATSFLDLQGFEWDTEDTFNDEEE